MTGKPKKGWPEARGLKISPASITTAIRKPGNAGLTLKKDPGFNLKLHSKKLASGKCQVKFYVNTSGRKCLYGYTLVEAHTTLKDVVKIITDKLKQKQKIGSYYHAHLFALGKKHEDWIDFMIFEV